MTTVTKVLTTYFNVEAGRREAKVWLAELKALSTEEKRELAELVCAATGQTLDIPNPGHAV